MRKTISFFICLLAVLPLAFIGSARTSSSGLVVDVIVIRDLPIKLAEIISIEPSASVEFTIKNGGQDCGETSLFYFDNPNRVLNFPNYGAKITISETN